MNRRDLLRTSLLGAIAAAPAAPPAPAREIPEGSDASKELESPDWKPVFLSEHQNQTLILLSDLIIPATDTPGAKAALVNRFLDLLMSVEVAETQRGFVTTLAYLDGECLRRYQSAFIHVPREQQIEFLTFLAYPHSHQSWGEKAEDFPGTGYFQQLKGWIVGAYYSSPAGLKELGWAGGAPHGLFAGCETHPK